MSIRWYYNRQRCRYRNHGFKFRFLAAFTRTLRAIILFLDHYTFVCIHVGIYYQWIEYIASCVICRSILPVVWGRTIWKWLERCAPDDRDTSIMIDTLETYIWKLFYLRLCIIKLIPMNIEKCEPTRGNYRTSRRRVRSKFW